MDETRARAARGLYSRTFAYTPNPLEGGFWGREFKLTLTQKKSRKPKRFPTLLCGMDETRTRDPLRDRQVF